MNSEKYIGDLYAITVSDTKVWGGSLRPWWAEGSWFRARGGRIGRAGRQLRIKTDHNMTSRQQ